MQVQIIDVAPPETSTTKTGRDYQSIEVVYKGENGQTASKKLMSFANPEMFKTAQTWQKGASINIDSQKDDNGYWQWKGVLAEGQAPAPVVNAVPRVGGSAPARATGNSYPTAEERAKIQTYIVRQSSLGHAVATLNIKGTKDLTTTPAKAVIALAKQYASYVLSNEVLDLEDDVIA